MYSREVAYMCDLFGVCRGMIVGSFISVSPKYEKKGGGEGDTTFPRDRSKLNIPVTTSKETNLERGGGGTQVPPFGGNTAFIHVIPQYLGPHALPKTAGIFSHVNICSRYTGLGVERT